MTITTQSNSNTNDNQHATATETSRVGIDQIVSEIQSVCTLPESLIKAVLATCISVKEEAIMNLVNYFKTLKEIADRQATLDAANQTRHTKSNVIVK